MTKDPIIEIASLPSVFQAQWKSNPDPSALPFARDNPPFALTAIDWQQLSLTDAEFTPHSWSNLQELIGANRLEDLKRWPSSLKAYLAWTAHAKERWGGVMPYLLGQRLFWEELDDEDDDGHGGAKGLRFKMRNQTPLTHTDDYAILRNDWPYAFEPGISHIVVWCKNRLPVDPDTGALSERGRQMVSDFVKREFRGKAGEDREGEKVLWFKNTTDLQSVRSLEHVHVLVRDVDEEVLGRWMV
ncbi:hypothetical protein DDE82_007425 [Stemphylium lycopersici]|uniref:N-acetylglucosamine-induced protein 1 n=1 Tax=Stemphylium lycopersici TaxID=183478 RepID=A0A364MVT6_STELY|nr:hypothetical protein TW65_01240 [Stemphylium lycopersici]RAR00266.1 hypothetical protein DDE82_007425 [Stemphylium lycopersici]RAR05157.1 hypothetical protein DDE83_007519 [Stemphylium lycopersici]